MTGVVRLILLVLLNQVDQVDHVDPLRHRLTNCAVGSRLFLDRSSIQDSQSLFYSPLHFTE